MDTVNKKRCYAGYNPDMTKKEYNPCGNRMTVDGVDYCPTNGKFDGYGTVCGFIKPWTEKDKEKWLQYLEQEGSGYGG